MRAIPVISSLLLLLNWFTPVEVNSYGAILFLIFLFISSSLLLLNEKLFKQHRKKYYPVILLTVGFICFGIYYFRWSGDWKTQTILYEKKDQSNRTIEFQLQDKGALGYNKRTVDKIEILPLINWVNDINENTIDSLEWKKS